MIGFACLLITLIFIGAVLAHKLIFSFALSALSGVPRWMLYSRRRSRGTQMFRNMMRRKGTSYPGQRRDDGGEEAQERVADDIEEAPPKPPAVEDSAKRVGHEVNMPDDNKGKDSGTTYLRNGDETPRPTEPPTFQARFRFTTLEREMDGDNTTAPNMVSRANDQTKGQAASQPREEQTFGSSRNYESSDKQESQNERLPYSGEIAKEETGVRKSIPQRSGEGHTENREPSVKNYQDEKVPPYRDGTVSHQRENDKQGGDKPQATLNETSGQTSVTPPKPRIRVRQERMPENLAEKQFNDERVPPPTDDS
jgi:hypothetical protein